MIQAERKDKSLVVDILTNSFDDNKSVNYIVQQDSRRISRIKALMAYSFDVCHEWGKVYLSDDKKGCALILYPHLKKTNLKAIWFDLMLVFKAIGVGRVGKAMSRESQIKARYPKEPFAYLWFIGVEPGHQKKGTGGMLMEEIIKDNTELNLEIFLETSTLSNLPWYNKYGFSTYDTIFFNYDLFMMKRKT